MLVPVEARQIITPLIAQKWSRLLAVYPDQDVTAFFLQGLADGFKTGYQYGNVRLKSTTKNMASALSHPTVIEEYIKDELSLSSLADDFTGMQSKVVI